MVYQSRDLFGLGDAPEAPAPQVNVVQAAANPAALLDQLAASGVTREQAARIFQQVWGSWPGLPPVLRFPENAVQLFPFRGIAPDPKQYPNIRHRFYAHVMADTVSTTINSSLPFSDHVSVYALSGEGRYDTVDPAAQVWGLQPFTIQFQRADGDLLLTQQVPANTIVGTAERPCPLCTPGWAFNAQQKVKVLGVAPAVPWYLWIVYHCVEYVGRSSLGMDRSILAAAG